MNNKVLIPNNRRNQIKDNALSILHQSQSTTLPTRLNNILHRYDWRHMTTDEAIRLNLIKNSDITAQTINYNGHYLIVYNNKHSIGRVRWSIAHEIGHIALRHFTRDIKDDIAEAEANYFAKEILMPIAVLDKCGCHTAEQIAKVCNVSLEAASYRLKDLARHNDYKAKYGFAWHDKMFLQQFNSMFNQEISAEICYFA